jgi:glyoxylase-like metal-dependent hydrolase (beta-lactamase superfamily II)
VAFAMRDEWKEEPVSTTGAEYVEPSATELIKPGQRVSHLFPRAVVEEFVLQRVTERVWWVTRQFYGSLFYVGKRGVLLFDPFLGGADATLAAIASVTSLPVTAVVYSHFHADHVGGARRLFELLAAAPPRVIASKNTATWMSLFRSDLPGPADVLDWPSGAARFEDVTVRLAGFPVPCHAPDHAMFLIEEERVGHTADVVNVDQLPFGRVRAPAGGSAGPLADRLPGRRAGSRSQVPAAVPAQQSLRPLRVRQADRGRLEALLGWRGPVHDREHP